MRGNQRIFSRLAAFGKWADTPEKVIEGDVKSAYVKSSLSWWANDFQSNFVPPPPRPPFLEELVTDGLTTCDLCGWAWSEKSFYSLEGQAENSNDVMWIILLIVVSFCSAIIGAIVMITALKYRRSNSIRALASRSGIKKQDFSPEQNMRNDQKHTQHEMKNASNIDLKFFMEDNTETDEAFYATLDDQDSINSENMTTYPKSTFCNKEDENDMPMFSSAPSSAYYSDMSNPPEKQYETIDNHFGTFDKAELNKCGSSFITLNNNNVITNRLSAIDENNFTSHNRDVNSDYV